MANLAAQQIDHELLNLQNGLFGALPPVRRGTLPSFELLVDKTPAPKAVRKAPSRALRMAGLIAVAAAVGVLAGASVWKLSAPERAGESAAVVAPASTAASHEARATERPASNVAPRALDAAPKPPAKVSPIASPKPAALAPVALSKAAEPPAAASKAAELPAATPAEAPAAAELPVAGAASDVPAAPVPAARSFDDAAATAAVAAASRSSGGCLDGDSGTLSMPVNVTFAPSGRVTRAILVGGSLVGTPAGSCVAKNLRAATVGAFDGAPVTITTVIRVR